MLPPSPTSARAVALSAQTAQTLYAGGDHWAWIVLTVSTGGVVLGTDANGVPLPTNAPVSFPVAPRSMINAFAQAPATVGVIVTPLPGPPTMGAA